MAKGKKRVEAKEKVEEKEQKEIEPSKVEEAVAEQPEEQDALEELEKELEEAQAQAAEYLDGWQRAQAEFSNYKKRQETERTQLRGFVTADVLRKILPVVDDFERAMETLPDDLTHLTWCEGVFLIKAKLDAILESENVTPIETEGQTFDPLHHEAVTYEEAKGYDEGQIIGEVQRGYMLDERVLRPALVRVAKAPAKAQAEASAPPSEESGDTEH